MLRAYLRVLVAAAVTGWAINFVQQDNSWALWTATFFAAYALLWFGLGVALIRSTGIEEAKARSWTSFGFLAALLLLLIPLALRVNLPEPHNFPARKIQLCAGLAYLGFGVFEFGIFIFFLMKQSVLINLKPRTLKLALFFLGLFFYVWVGSWMSYCNQPTGDEPHYLLMAHSLVYDHDLDLKNNYENRDYQAFYKGKLTPQSPGFGGTIYSHHSPGLPLLMAGPYWLGGKKLVLLMMLTNASLYALGIFLLVVHVFKQKKRALWVWLICLTSAPMIIFSNHLATEMTRGCLFTFLFLGILTRRDALFPWLLGLGLGFACWMHDASYPIAALLLAVYFFYGDWKSFIVANSTCLALVGLLLIFNIQHFGSILSGHLLNQFVVGGNSDYLKQTVHPFLVWGGNVVRGSLGQFFDQEFGLLIYAPVFGCIPLGFLYLRRDRRDVFLPLLLIFLVYLFFIGCFGMWHGGTASPRFMVPIHFIFALALGAVVFSLKGEHLRRPFSLMVIAGWLMSFLFVWIPWMRFNSGTGKNWIFVILEKFIHWPLHLLFPSLWIVDMRSYVMTVVYAVLIAVVSLAVYKRQKAEGRD